MTHFDSASRAGDTGSARHRGRPSHATRKLKALLSVRTPALFLLGVLATIGFLNPRHSHRLEQHAPARPLPIAEPSSHAFGRSGAVQVRFAMPGAPVEYPIRLSGDPTALAYEWVRIADATSIEIPRPLAGDTVTAPREPGFYHLALVRDGVRRILNDLTVAVMLPFEEKRGATIDGYRIGTYVAEMVGGSGNDRPAGFVKVTPADEALSISKHLRMADFLTQDGQTTWPRYAAVSPRVLDKLELVLAELASWRGDSTPVGIEVDVHSAYRSPSYNRVVRSAARDSRHQYGDAVDVAIDANGDGRFTLRDARLVARAVDAVEAKYPDLVGGMGVYASRRIRHPYVHIDARGQRARWRG
ncbi:MAG TPA: D-Ala-D-Ala carboxypeptidase family metallohydrolase [Gemmatimonadaceae bacterium]|nr:D-Ala-D-Ala carboxypeptidase family metallohydrolase [Gemmatimonadaceae bacterium]